MIVIDSSIWIDHIHTPVPQLNALLLREHALMHPHVLGEIALGSIRDRNRLLARFELLPVPNIAEEGYVLYMIDERNLMATGIGYTDAHLLASTFLTPNGKLWTRDKRLYAHADRFGLAYTP
jgi:predicted nucleic acid-binding protein